MVPLHRSILLSALGLLLVCLLAKKNTIVTHESYRNFRDDSCIHSFYRAINLSVKLAASSYHQYAILEDPSSSSRRLGTGTEKCFSGPAPSSLISNLRLPL